MTRPSHTQVRTRFGAAAAIALAAAIVAGCGGGPASDMAVAPEVQSATALVVLNGIRTRTGLGAVTLTPSLNQAAQAHADYLQVNGTTGSLELSSNPGFTGTDVTARIRAVSYPATFVIEAQSESASGQTAAAMLDTMMQAPYRRLAILLHRVNDVGVGHAAGPPSKLVLDLAYTAANLQTPALEAALWPVDAATTVPLSGCCESPDPMPELGGQPWGYPVSVHVNESRRLLVTSFTLVNASSAAVPTKLLTADTDTTLAALNARHVAVLMPLAPLSASTRYTAQLTATLDGAPFARTWSFTTAPN